MAFAAYNYTITDESGNVVTGCSIEVRREIDNVLVPLYSDRDGASAISNPFTDSTGTGRFHAAGSAYKITASKTGFSRSFRFVAIGLAGETDFTFTTFFGIWNAATTYPLGAYVIYNDVGIFLSTADGNLNNAPDSATPGSTSDWVYYPGVVGPQGEAGLIGTWEGLWVTSTAYSVNDAVFQGGSSYICIEAHTSGTFSTDLAADKWELVAQKGNTGAGVVVRLQVFTSSGTYTPHPSMDYCEIECVGGGGGGGGTANSSGGTFTMGGGGGGGGWAYKISSDADIGASKAVTIGAGGAGGAAGNNIGGAGGNTSVGTLCVANGGAGGGGNPGGSNNANGGAGGTAGTGDVSIPGQNGFSSVWGATTALVQQGFGGASRLGFGGVSGILVSLPGNNYGGGGAGGNSFAAGGADAGAAGAGGVVIITEYCSA